MNSQTTTNTRWRVASGHAATTGAAVSVLEAGGNAADAAVAAAFAACVAEPLLCSIGGGAHAIVHRRGRAPVSLDAFTHTPRRRRIDDLDFYPITGDFGTDTQEFHVGMASIATPGMLAGMDAMRQRFGRLPLAELTEPAVALAGEGVALNELQHYTARILEPIVRASDASARLFGLRDHHDDLPEIGTRLNNPDLSGFLQQLGREGPDLFYRGEPARRLAADSVERGGHLGLEDLSGYRVHWRRPLSWRYREARLWSTPPPAFGGIMLALAGHALESLLDADAVFGSPSHIQALIHAMARTEDLRGQLERPELLHSGSALKAAFHGLLNSGPWVSRGTTQISVDDGQGLAVSLTLSNGEGSGYVLPGTGVMLNNMLGEEDINRGGFHNWPANRRLGSMMAPTLLEHAGKRYLLGSGGSNRIRTVLMQLICNLVDFDLPLADAVDAPRLHLEGRKLSVETPADGWPLATAQWLNAHYPEARHWPERNMFFGGVHAVGPFDAAADRRRLGQAAMQPGDTDAV